MNTAVKLLNYIFLSVYLVFLLNYNAIYEQTICSVIMMITTKIFYTFREHYIYVKPKCSTIKSYFRQGKGV